MAKVRARKRAIEKETIAELRETIVRRGRGAERELGQEDRISQRNYLLSPKKYKKGYEFSPRSRPVNAPGQTALPSHVLKGKNSFISSPGGHMEGRKKVLEKGSPLTRSTSGHRKQRGIVHFKKTTLPADVARSALQEGEGGKLETR